MAAAAGDGLDRRRRWLGVSTTGYAAEGGYNGPGQPANDWAPWERSGLAAVSGVGCDFWRRPETVLDRAAALGCDAFGLSVEWARVEPEDGRVDTGALDRYDRILSLCQDRGLSPVVTLHHRVHPWWLGGEHWLMPGSPDRFAAHVATVVERLGARCNRWVTVHEPNTVAAAGWVLGTAPPGRLGAVSDAWAVCDNLLVAHVLAYEVVHRLQADARVTMAPRSSAVYDFHHLLVDLLSARGRGVERADLDRWLDGRRASHDREAPPAGAVDRAVRVAAAATSPYGARAGGTHGARAVGGVRSFLRRPSPRRVVDAVYGGPHPLPLDAVAVSWHQPSPGRLLRRPSTGAGALPRSGGAQGTSMSRRRGWWLRPAWEVPPDPGGLARWCRSPLAAVPELPRWVLDGGLAEPDDRAAPGRSARRSDGWDRPGHLRAELGALSAAAADGSPVQGYLYRSMADGHQVGSDGARYGIFRTDRRPGEEGVDWSDLDAAGDDAAAAFRALAADRRARPASSGGVRRGGRAGSVT